MDYVMTHLSVCLSLRFFQRQGHIITEVYPVNLPLPWKPPLSKQNKGDFQGKGCMTINDQNLVNLYYIIIKYSKIRF